MRAVLEKINPTYLALPDENRKEVLGVVAQVRQGSPNDPDWRKERRPMGFYTAVVEQVSVDIAVRDGLGLGGSKELQANRNKWKTLEL